MSPRFPSWFVVVALIMLGGCATRPINPPITQANLETGYTFQTRQKHFKSQENLVVLAFSGGGTRAAAFSYGVLEFLRRTEVMGSKGNTVRLLDAVSMITGVSGGSFTALAYGLYGEKLFADYEQRFLKRDVQGELIARLVNPGYWGDFGRQAGAVPNWRPSCTTRSCSTARLRRPRSRRRPFHCRVGDRHRERRSGSLQPKRLQCAVHGSQCDTPVARCGGIVGGPRGAVSRHDQQLRRHLR